MTSKAKKDKIDEKLRERLDESQEDDQNQEDEESDQQPNKRPREDNNAQKKWFQNEEELDDEKKWDYIEHHGVTFPDPYIPHSIPPLYSGQPVKLTAYEQELTWYWCQSMNTEWENNEIYKKNFETQFMKRFAPGGVYTDFNKFDFSPIKAYFDKVREQKKNISEEKKAENKANKEQLNKFYGYALVDGMREKTNGFLIEPPTLFKGRGKHPKAGFMKARIQPEIITINIAESAPIPVCPLAGHHWAEIVHKHDVTWLCSYKDDSINPNSSYKYIFLSASSKFKGINDKKKYEKARKLKNHINDIRKDYEHKLQSSDPKNKQLGTATYLIDTLALRVGNEKGEDEADTVGCCSLRVQHIELLPNNQITLDFLGKDSMRYYNTVQIKPIVWKNIEGFIKGKKKQDDLFDKIDAQTLNDYLRGLMQGLTAKVFRTYNASYTLQKELNKYTNIIHLKLQDKFEKYEQANRQVAILCNHQKTVSKKADESLKNFELSIQVDKAHLKKLNNHLRDFTNKNTRIQKEDEVITLQSGKELVMKFPETREATQSAIVKLQATIQKNQKKFRKKDQSKQIALGTSKTNYNDPRISVAWCKKNEVKIEKVFTKNLLSKFLWAMYTDLDWEF